MINVVVFNGGRGAGSFIPELFTDQNINLTSIVNAYDDGKSTGEIRDFFDMLGPSDLRKVQELMLPKNDTYYKPNLALFRYRFPIDCSHDHAVSEILDFINGKLGGFTFGLELDIKIQKRISDFLSEFLDSLKLIEKIRRKKFNFSDCSIMNCIYAGAFIEFNRNLEDTAKYIGYLFGLRGSVLPTNIENKQLVALRESGEVLYTEADIVELRSNVLIEKIFILDKILEPNILDKLDKNEKRKFLDISHSFVNASDSVILSIKQADIIIYSAGTQHSSLYPTYLSKGISASIAESNSLKVFITNIGADYETPTYKTSEYISGAYKYLCMPYDRNFTINDFFDIDIINHSKDALIDSYVEDDVENFNDIQVERVVGHFEDINNPGKHNGKKLIDVILQYFIKK